MLFPTCTFNLFFLHVVSVHLDLPFEGLNNSLPLFAQEHKRYFQNAAKQILTYTNQFSVN